MAKIRHFAKKNKKASNNMVKGTFLKKNSQIITTFQGRKYEIAKIFGGFGQIFSIFTYNIGFLFIYLFKARFG